MDNWKEYKLKDVAFLTTGFPFDGHKYGKDGVRVVRGDNVTIGNLRWDPEKDKRWSEPFERASEYSLNVDDIVIGMDGSRVGKNRAQVKASDLPLLLAQRVACVRHNELSIQSYLYYQIFNDKFEQYIKAVQTGTSIPHVSLKQIGDYPIMLPSLSVQHKISDVLKSLDDKIECNRRINENLEQQAQALFDRVLMNEKLPRDKVLKDYAFINPTRSIKKSEIARYIDMSSLPTKGSFPLDWVDKPYNGGMKFQNGDTLMARITPCLENGKTAYINFLDKEEIAFGSTEYIVIAPHEGIPSELFYFLARNNDFVSYAVAHMNGSSGRQRVSAADIENYIMPNIPSNIIEQFGERAKNTMECIKNNSIESRRLAELRDTLLPKLMSGEINVNEVKI